MRVTLELIESLAARLHEIKSGWLQYVMAYVIKMEPSKFKELKQIADTKFCDLPSLERDMLREDARSILVLIESVIRLEEREGQTF